MEPPATHFRIADADERLRRATRSLTVALLAGVVGLGGLSFLLLAAGLARGQEPWEVAGIAVGVVGLLLCVPVVGSLRVRYQEVAVDRRGLTLVMADGRRWRARWDDPSLRFLLFDHSATRSTALRAYRSVPCQLFCVQFHVGLSPEAYGAILAQAATAGVVQRNEADADGTRTVTVGPGPEAGTPFRRD